MQRSSRRLVIVVLLNSVAAQAHAQTVGAGVVGLTSEHELLGGRLVGGEIIVAQQRGDSSFALHMRGALLRGHATRIGIPCAGLIPPIAACAVQPLRDDARMAEGSLGASLRVLHAPRGELSITADVAAAQFRVESRPKAGGDPLIAGKLFVGVYVGAGGAWHPLARLPLAVEASVALGGFRPLMSELVPDGYTPFEGGLSVHRISAGIAWHIR